LPRKGEKELKWKDKGKTAARERTHGIQMVGKHQKGGLLPYMPALKKEKREEGGQ